MYLKHHLVVLPVAVLVLQLLSSCEVLTALTAPAPTETVIQNLKLDYHSYHGLLCNINVNGTVKNTGYKTIYDTRIKATITHKNGTLTYDEISIDVGITSGSTITFEDKITATCDDQVTLAIVAARY